jgi:cullin 1
MYALLARIPEGLEPLRRKFEAHVKAAGLGAVTALVGSSGEGKAAGESALIFCIAKSY